MELNPRSSIRDLSILSSSLYAMVHPVTDNPVPTETPYKLGSSSCRHSEGRVNHQTCLNWKSFSLGFGGIQSDVTLINYVSNATINFKCWADVAYQGTLAAMTPWAGLMPLAKDKCWLGSLALLTACLAHSGGMCQDSKNALPKLRMWTISESWRRRGMEGGRSDSDGGMREQVVQKDI